MDTANFPDPVDYQAVRAAYGEWRRFVETGSAATAAAFETFYHDRVAAPFRTHTTTAEAIFNDEMFPSLFSSLPIHARADIAAIDTDALPREWHPASISAQIGDNPLARFLLAFIWKQGDFDKVKHVLAGFRGSSGTTAVVLQQFGQHLRSPLNHPIFDQHTARHTMLYNRLFDERTAFSQFRCFFGRKRGSIPSTQVTLTNLDRLREFQSWWTDKLGNDTTGRLPPVTNATERGEAILWADRTMFSLGKAAALVLPKASTGNT